MKNAKILAEALLRETDTACQMLIHEVTIRTSYKEALTAIVEALGTGNNTMMTSMVAQKQEESSSGVVVLPEASEALPKPEHEETPVPAKKVSSFSNQEQVRRSILKHLKGTRHTSAGLTDLIARDMGTPADQMNKLKNMVSRLVSDLKKRGIIEDDGIMQGKQVVRLAK